MVACAARPITYTDAQAAGTTPVVSVTAELLGQTPSKSVLVRMWQLDKTGHGVMYGAGVPVTVTLIGAWH